MFSLILLTLQKFLTLKIYKFGHIIIKKMKNQKKLSCKILIKEE